MTEFKHTIDKRDKSQIERIQKEISKTGYYFVGQSQKRKVTGWQVKGDKIILTGTIVSPIS